MLSCVVADIVIFSVHEQIQIVTQFMRMSCILVMFLSCKTSLERRFSISLLLIFTSKMLYDLVDKLRQIDFFILMITSHAIRTLNYNFGEIIMHAFEKYENEEIILKTSHICLADTDRVS